MSETVSFDRQGEIGLIRVDNPPVNALSQSVRAGLQEAVRSGEADDAVEAMVILCEGRTFIAGADITEFGKPPAEPDLVSVIDDIEGASKPVVAAIHGTALGGGLEVTLGCHCRVADPKARVGFPEVHLGLLPGAGGTQRTPRLTGVEPALELIVEGSYIPAEKARELGIIDEIAEGELGEAAVAKARQLAQSGEPLRRLSELDVESVESGFFDKYRERIAQRKRGFLAPFRCIDAVRAATELPFKEGMKRERELFAELMVSPESAAQRHVFFAEREVAKVPGVSKDTPKREINTAAVIGAGTMGGGIAMNFANAGIPVYIKEVDQEALDKGLDIIRKNYERSVKRGRLTEDDVEKRMSLIRPTLDYGDIADADLVIEAVFEDMDLKKKIFTTLDETCKQGAILATNTSTLDVDEIAASTGRPQDVMGMHFFSPANVMKLLENVRGNKTADDVVATVMDISKRIGKVPVCVGVCYGFVGNRMLHQRGREANALVEEGATPWQVDKVIYDFGFPMGPFAMGDLAGLDVGYRIRQEQAKAGNPEAQKPNWTDRLVEQNRLGQKTGAGVYKYGEDGRTPEPDPEVDRLIEDFRREQGIQPREISDEEIRERCLYVMVNEGAKILEEGIAARALDVDIVWIYGYGFPVYRGGPMFWADQVGVDSIHEAVKGYHERLGGDHWRPGALLERLAREGKGFHSQ